MKTLTIGHTGLIGHKIFNMLGGDGISGHEAVIDGITSEVMLDFSQDIDILADIIVKNKYDCIVNCVGGMPYHIPMKMTILNTAYPFLLANSINNINTRLIHLSTDCVFKHGVNMVSDKPNAETLYGKTKAVAENILLRNVENCYIVRTSVIGFTPNKDKHGLLDWLWQQTEPVTGFTKAKFNGLSNIEIANRIALLVNSDKGVKRDDRIIHFAAEDYKSKYEILESVSSVLNLQPVTSSNDDFPFRLLKGYTPKALNGLWSNRDMKSMIGEIILDA